MDGMGKTQSSWALLASTLLISTLPHFAQAQELTPMRKAIRSFGNEFAVRVHPKNPYRHRIDVSMHVYDHRFRPIKAIVRPRGMSLGGGASRPVQVIIPFNGKTERKVRICALTTPFKQTQTLVSTRVCGKYLGTRVK